MKNRERNEFVHARKMFIQDALNEIIDVKYHYEFRRRAFCVIAKLGLQMDAKRENLFLFEEWSNPERKEDLIRRIEKFLVKHIK